MASNPTVKIDATQGLIEVTTAIDEYLLYTDQTNKRFGVLTDSPLATFEINTSGGEIPLLVNGDNGTLFSVIDDMSDYLYEVTDISGIPQFSVHSYSGVEITERLVVGGDVNDYTETLAVLGPTITSGLESMDTVLMHNNKPLKWLTSTGTEFQILNLSSNADLFLGNNGLKRLYVQADNTADPGILFSINAVNALTIGTEIDAYLDLNVNDKTVKFTDGTHNPWIGLEGDALKIDGDAWVTIEASGQELASFGSNRTWLAGDTIIGTDATPAAILHVKGGDDDHALYVDGRYSSFRSPGGETRVYIYHGNDGNAAYMALYDYAEAAQIKLDTVGVSYFNGGDFGIGRSPTENLDLYQNSGLPTTFLIDNISSTGATGSSIIARTDATIRGAGIYMHETATHKQWYAGVPYNHGFGNYQLGYRDSTQYETDTATSTYAVFKIGDTGDTNIYNPTTGPTNLFALTDTGDLTIPGTLTAAGLAAPNTDVPDAPAACSGVEVGVLTQVGFEESTSSGVEQYEIWTSVTNQTDFGLMAIIPSDDFSFAPDMSVDDDTYNITSTTLYYRVYAVANGSRSTATTCNVTVSNTVADPSFTIQPMVDFFYIYWDVPTDRRLDYIEVYADSAATDTANRGAASLVYSGTGGSFMYLVAAGEEAYYHDFWVESVTRT